MVWFGQSFVNLHSARKSTFYIPLVKAVTGKSLYIVSVLARKELALESLNTYTAIVVP